MNDLHEVYSKRFKVRISYYDDDTRDYGDDDIMTAWGVGSDGRGYHILFVNGVFDDSETEVARNPTTAYA